MFELRFLSHEEVSKSYKQVNQLNKFPKLGEVIHTPDAPIFIQSWRVEILRQVKLRKYYKNMKLPSELLLDCVGGSSGFVSHFYSTTVSSQFMFR